MLEGIVNRDGMGILYIYIMAMLGGVVVFQADWVFVARISCGIVFFRNVKSLVIC